MPDWIKSWRHRNDGPGNQFTFVITVHCARSIPEYMTDGQQAVVQLSHNSKKVSTGISCVENGEVYWNDRVWFTSTIYKSRRGDPSGSRRKFKNKPFQVVLTCDDFACEVNQTGCFSSCFGRSKNRIPIFVGELDMSRYVGTGKSQRTEIIQLRLAPNPDLNQHQNNPFSRLRPIYVNLTVRCIPGTSDGSNDFSNPCHDESSVVSTTQTFTKPLFEQQSNLLRDRQSSESWQSMNMNVTQTFANMIYEESSEFESRQSNPKASLIEDNDDDESDRRNLATLPESDLQKICIQAIMNDKNNDDKKFNMSIETEDHFASRSPLSSFSSEIPQWNNYRRHL